MAGTDSTDNGVDTAKLLLAIGIGLVFLSGAMAIAAGDGSPDDRVGVRAGIVGGTQFENLSEAERERLQPVLDNGTDIGVLNKSTVRERFPSFPNPEELAASGVYYVEYEGRFYELAVDKESTTEYQILVTDRTDTVRIEYEELSMRNQNVVSRAAETEGPINVSSLGPVYQADGLSGGPLGSQRLYYLSWDDQYYTFATYEPIEFIDAPAPGRVLGVLGIILGSIVAVAGYILLVRDS